MTHSGKYIWQGDKWPDFYWDSAKLMRSLGECRFKQGALLNRVRNLNMDEELLLRSETVIEESIRTSAIEGEKLDPEGVRSSVSRRLGLADAGLVKMPGKNIEGLVDILQDATMHYSVPLTVERLFGWHSALFSSGYSGIQRIITGKFRDDRNGPMRILTGPIGKERTVYEAPPAESLGYEMDKFLQWFEDAGSSMDGIIRTGIAHVWFAAIHPFDDGNGRLARTICDMALSRDEKMPVRYYSLSSRILEERTGYYDSLASATCGEGDITAWLSWFIGMMSRAIDHSERTLENITLKSRFWKIYDSAGLNERQKKVLNRLLNAGREGFEGGMTNRKYAGINHVSRATAQRELAELRDFGILSQSGSGGRSISYRLKFLEVLDGEQE